MVLRIAGVPEHFNYPWRLALADGAFSAAGLDVEFIDYPGGTGAMTAALEAGEVDAAMLLTEGAMLDILRGGERALIKVYVESALTWGIHVAADSDIHDTCSLDGRRIAISRHGSGSHLIAIVDALERGLDPDQMPLVVVGSLDGARRALADGEADIFLWEKHMTQPLVDGGEFRRIGQRVVPWPAFVASARKAFLEDRTDDLRAALDIVSGYAKRLKEGPDSATEISSAYGISLHDARHWLADVKWAEGYERPDEALHRVLAALQTQGATDSTPPSLDIIWPAR